MIIELPNMLFESIIPALAFACTVGYQTAVLKTSGRFFNKKLEDLSIHIKDRLDKLDLQISKITDILIKQESHTQRIDALEVRLTRIEDTDLLALRASHNNPQG